MAAAPSPPTLPQPTETETLLLRASLPTGAEAAAAWRAWRARVPLDDIDPGGFRLLPQVYQNLSQFGITDADLPRLKGVYRKAWVENQVGRRALELALDGLSQAGIPVLMPAGEAVAQRWYTEPSARHCDDREIMIPSAQAGTALQALGRRGWRRWDGKSVAATSTYGSWSTRLLVPDGGAHVDFRSHLLRESYHLETDQHWWPCARAFRLDDRAAQGLDPADQLLCVCVSGNRGNAPVRLRWAADAWRILAGAAQVPIDWEHFVRMAAALALSLPLTAALHYLRSALDAPLPAGLLQRLQAIPVAPAEARYHRLNAAPRGRWGEAPVLFAGYARRQHQGAHRGPLGLIQFLGEIWGVSSAGAVAAQAARRVLTALIRPLISSTQGPHQSK